MLDCQIVRSLDRQFLLSLDHQIARTIIRSLYSVCNFQSMKSSVKLNGLLPKFFCYITWLLHQLIRRDTGRLANEAFTLNPFVSSKQLLNGLKITNCIIRSLDCQIIRLLVHQIVRSVDCYIIRSLDHQIIRLLYYYIVRSLDRQIIRLLDHQIGRMLDHKIINRQTIGSLDYQIVKSLTLQIVK